MLYFFYNPDKQKLREKSSKLFQSLKQKKPDATFVSVDNELFDEKKLEELLETQGLFESKLVINLFNLLSEEDFKEIIKKHLKDIQNSPNIFILSETKIAKKFRDILEKHAEKADIKDEEVKESPKKEFNNFALADALGQRNKKTLWSTYLKAKEKSSIEEIHGILFWQIKSMILALRTKSAEEAGLKPFVYTKARGFAKNYYLEELQKISDDFVSMYHDAHQGKCDFAISLERFILAL